MCFYHQNVISSPVSKICYYEKRRHINATRGFCHGNILQGDKVVIVTHISIALKDFELDNLQLGLSVSQVMAKHHRNVQKLIETSKNLTKDTFLCEQDILTIARKLAKETYKKHENDVESVYMWAEDNPNVLFYYQKIGLEVGGMLSGNNIPFIIKIWTPS